MISQSKVQHRVPREHLTALRTDKLGRHYHSVPCNISNAFARQPRLMGDYFLRHYRMALEGQGVIVHEQPPEPAQCLFANRIGTLGFSADRTLLAQLLESYYGGAKMPGQDMPPVSASEQRLLQRLGQDVLRLCCELLLGSHAPGRIEPSSSTLEQTWEYCLQFELGNSVSGVRSALWVYLDAAMVDEVIRRLPRLEPRPVSSAHPCTVTDLPVQLDCVVVNFTMALSQLLTLQPDDIVMVRLPERCDVRIHTQRLFSATVAQRAGGLALTSLDSMS